MSPYDIAFFICSALTLICGALVILNRNPVTSAMCLVLSMTALSGLFVLLQAFFLAAVQVLVYAGAVMVLFLFVIMLLDLKEEARRRIKLIRAVLSLVAVGAVIAIVLNIIWANHPSANLAAPSLVGATAPLGQLLFKQFLLPFEILSLLLLVAMLGVILLSKKEVK